MDGYSASAWKSLAVKSLRMGWPTGLIEAQKRLGKSYMKAAMVCAAFEDIFPAVSELEAVRSEIAALDYRALCLRQTHHARGHTKRFCELENETCGLAKNRPDAIMQRGRSYGLALSPRACNVFWTWHLMQPADEGIRRTLDETPWTGMPEAMLDSHTPEGRVAKRRMTILSGHYSQHAQLAQIVSEKGWEHVRRIVHGKTTVINVPKTLVQSILL